VDVDVDVDVRVGAILWPAIKNGALLHI